MKPVLIAVVFLAAISVLVIVGLRNLGTPVLALGALTDGTYAEKHAGKRVQIDNGKIVHIESLAPLRFDIATTETSSEVIRVVSQRAPPDNFKVGIPVSCTGTFDPQARVFTATKIATQCPSTYRPEQDLKGGPDPYAEGREKPSDALLESPHGAPEVFKPAGAID